MKMQLSSKSLNISCNQVTLNVLRLDLSSFSNVSIFDFFDKKKVHFNTQQPYQFGFRLNYSYDCFLLALHYNLYLTYFVFYLHFGFGIKTRTNLPLYKFHR